MTRRYLVPTELTAAATKVNLNGEQVVLGLPLPQWNDATAIASYFSSAIMVLTTIFTLVHPGFTIPTAVDAAVAPAASVIAGVIQIVNVITHRGVTKAVASALATGKVRVVASAS